MKPGITQFRRWLAICAAIACCFITAPVTADEPLRLTIIDPFVDLHTGPGRGYPIVQVAEYGETITLLKKRTDWIKVETRKGFSGWAHQQSLALTLGEDGKLLEIEQLGVEDFVNRRWNAGVAAGDFGGADALSVFAGYRFTPNLTLEGKVTHAVGNFSDSVSVGVSLLHEIWPHWRVSPYFTMGVAVIEINPDATLVQTEDRTDTMMLVGGGLQAYVSRRIMLRFEYVNNLILTSRNENEEVKEWKLGLNVFF